MKKEPAKDLQERIKEESKAYSGSVMENEYNPLRKYTSDDLIEEIEYAFEQGANFILEVWEEAERYNMNNMKTEARKILSNLNDRRITVSQATEQVMYLIAQAQKEAYNQAIDDAAKKAKVKRFMTRYDYPVYCVDKQSILKLKK